MCSLSAEVDVGDISALCDGMVRDKSWIIKVIIQPNITRSTETEQTSLTLLLATETQISLKFNGGRVGDS